MRAASRAGHQEIIPMPQVNHPHPDHDQLLAVPAVARRLAVCDKTVRRLIACGDLSAHRIGRQLRISEKELKRFLHARHKK
jgi:excisionase family DNA binding protein